MTVAALPRSENAASPLARVGASGDDRLAPVARLARRALRGCTVLIAATRGDAPKLLAVAGESPRDDADLVAMVAMAPLSALIHDRDGTEAGVVCVADAAPRTWSDEDADVLRDAASAAAQLLFDDSLAHDVQAGRELMREAEGMGGWGSWELEVGGAVRVSEGMWRIVGIAPRRDTLTFDEWLARVHREDRPTVLSTIHRTIADGGPHELRHRLVRLGGEVRTVSARLRMRQDGVGGPARLVGVSRDVSSEEAAIGALRDSEARYRLMFEENPLPMWIHDVDTLEILAVNDAAVTAYGWTREEFVRMTLDDLRPRDDAASLHERPSQTPSADAVMRRVRHRRKDGTVLRVDVHGHALDMFGRPARLVLAHDVSDQVAAEDALRESEARFRAFVEQSSDVTFVVRPDGTVTYMSPSMTRVLGYAVDEMMGRDVFSFVVEEDREAAQAVLHNLLANAADTHREELLVRHADGSMRALEVRGRPLPTADGSMTHLIVSARDVTERRVTEAALRASEERFRSLVTSSPLGVFLTDAGGGVTFANPRAQDLWDRGEAALMGSGWERAIHPEDREAVVNAWTQSVRMQRDFQAEYRVVLRDGQHRWVHEIARPLRDASGAHTGAVSMLEDVTGRRDLEAQLRQAQKMEAVGQLAGGIAHDFNNLLTVIKAHAEFLLEALPEHAEARDDAREIGLAAARAASLTRQLLAFSRKQLLRPRTLDVNEVVAELAPMLHRLIGEDVAIAIRPTAAAALVRADPGQLEQVVVNLAVNARDAMPAGGTITVATTESRLSEPLPHEHGVVPAGDYVVLEVADTGTGMPEAVRLRAFEPFFTTKGPGRGTGLGLATVYGIVRQSGGHVTLESVVDAGTCLRVYLPMMKCTPAEQPAMPVTVETAPSTILLVEDEAPLRALARRMLERKGHRVLEASDASHALELASAHPEIDLLITDVVMPGMNGRELSDLVVAMRPGVRTMFMSGYTDDVIVRRGALSPRLVLVHKPFTTDELLRAVARVLHGG